MRPALVLATLCALGAAVPARAEVASVLFGNGAPAALEAPVPVSALALAAAPLGGGDDVLAARISGDGLAPRAPRHPKKGRAEAPAKPRRMPAVLDASRARILLRSLTVPGWGQATAGHTTSAMVFGVAEAGIWGSFVAFHVQEALRTETYERTAHLFAGIDLKGRDEEFRRIVGSYLSNDEYNRLVVFRDAANLYYEDPVAYRAYIAAHALGGNNTWAWGSVDQLLRYRAERQYEQRAAQRANTALAFAVANRLVSMVHAARVAGRPPAAPRSWNLECVPRGGADPTALRFQLSARF